MPPRTASRSSAPPAPRTAARKKLTGCTAARLYTEPLRPLNRKTSAGFDAADFAELTRPFLPWQRWNYIHALELNPDGSYRFRIVLTIVARQNGKSDGKRTVTLWRMYMRPRTRVLGVAQNVGLAREQWNLSLETVRGTPDLAAELGPVRNVNGDEMYWLANGSRYKIGAASGNARGGSNDEVNIDELREQRDWKGWSALSKTTMARPNSQIHCLSNAGDDYSVVLNQLRDSALTGRDPSVGIFEWSAPDGCELDDTAAWRHANPGLGYIISEPAIRTALHTDPPEVFRTEVLCQRVENLASAIDGAAWRDCADASGTLERLRGRIALCFDAAPDGQHATLAAAAALGDGRVRIEIVKAWHGTDEARRDLDHLFDRIKARAIAWYPSGPGGALAPVLRRRGHSLELAGVKVTEACQGLADLVRGRQVIHPADPLLDAHITAASKLHTGDGWRFTRRDTGHVDAAYAAAGAAYAALTLPKALRPQIRVMGA